MSLIIIGKVSLASLGAGSVAVGGFFLHRLLNPTVEIYGFLNTSTTVSTGVQKFECKIPNFDAFECSVKEVEKLDQTASSKNHVSLDKLTGTKDVELSKDKLDSTKFYKIIIASSVFDSPKQLTPKSTPEPVPSWKSIEVFEKTGSSPSNLGTINVLSVIKNGVEIKFKLTLGEWKTNHFVGQASTVPSDLKDISEYKCSWKKDASDLKACTIKPFVAGDSDNDQKESEKIADLTFTKDSSLTEDKKITQHHYYLIEFADPSDAKDKTSFTESEMVYLKQGTEEKVTFKKLSAVKLIGDQLLILKQQQTAS